MPLSSAAEAADAASPVGNLMEPKEIVEKLRMLREVTAFFCWQGIIKSKLIIFVAFTVRKEGGIYVYGWCTACPGCIFCVASNEKFAANKFNLNLTV